MTASPPPGPCRCWTHDSALGHEGHCCFLRDDRKGWRTDAEVCHTPAPEPPPTAPSPKSGPLPNGAAS